jgi:pyruvate,water dikinase
LGRRLGEPEPAVAVRSSAIDEDGAEASFAGQHETYLNISGIDNIAEAIVRCWKSAHSERALEYRRQNGLSTVHLKLAVLVQALVPADASAVVFSANPINRRRDEVVINASWGLGESVVGGLVTPDAFVVRRADLRHAGARRADAGMCIVSRQIAEKASMTVAVAGGTRQVNVPSLLRRLPSISDEQAVKMAQLALDLQAEMGYPVDVECAYTGGKLYLLQCRPITTLAVRQPAAVQAPALANREAEALRLTPVAAC